MSYLEKIERLAELFQRDHGGCDDRTCSISVAFENGYGLWGIYLFSESGASCEEFNKIYKTLPKKFEKEAELERQELIKNVSHEKCSGCNAIGWDVGELWLCDCCGKENGKEK